MAPRPSQIRTYRILGILAVLHSAVVLGLYLEWTFGSWLWLGLATSFFLWLLVLALHPGRSILRFLIPTIIAGALFAPCAIPYGFLIHSSAAQWLAADQLEKLLRSNPRIILYSIDADHTRPLEVRKGYRRLGINEVILPDDMFNNHDEFARMDEAEGVIATGQTVDSIADETVKSYYGKGWQILRKETGGSNEAETEVEVTPDAKSESEPYKAPAVLGYAEITDRAEQRTLITTLASSARYTKGGALCHNPRHGLYVETGTSTIDLSICFECGNVYTFAPAGRTGPFAPVGGFAITRAPESIFNATLKRHGITLSQGPPH